MFRQDYISFPVGETLAVLVPGRTVEIGRRNIGDVSERILGVKKKFRDIIEYAAVMISDESISWIESKTVGEIPPDSSGNAVPSGRAEGENSADAAVEREENAAGKTVSGAILQAMAKLLPPADGKSETERRR